MIEEEIDLSEDGALCTLRRSTPGVYNPATGTATTSLSTCPTYAVLDASILQTLGFKFGAGLVQGGDIKALISAKGLTFTPAPGDNLQMGAVTYKVIAVAPTYVMDQAVVFDLLVRR